tara:strand:- start:1233 stop:1586 length:354 start_codon:yes stop_codon:yes gene_type:complete
MDNMSKIIFFCLAVITTLLIYQNNQLKENIDLVNEQIEALSEEIVNGDQLGNIAFDLANKNMNWVNELVSWSTTDEELIARNNKELEKLEKEVSDIKFEVGNLTLMVDDLMFSKMTE